MYQAFWVHAQRPGRPGRGRPVPEYCKVEAVAFVPSHCGPLWTVLGLWPWHWNVCRKLECSGHLGSVPVTSNGKCELGRLRTAVSRPPHFRNGVFGKIPGVWDEGHSRACAQDDEVRHHVCANVAPDVCDRRPRPQSLLLGLGLERPHRAQRPRHAAAAHPPPVPRRIPHHS